jgi:hypothetical protein
MGPARFGDLRNVGFTEFCRLIEAFGFKLRRVSGEPLYLFSPQGPEAAEHPIAAA